jgi:AcrR family transcriptional regulator
MDGGAPIDRRTERGAASSDATASRDRLVLAAVELAVEHHESGTGLRDVFKYLTPSAVAQRAGLSRGLIYHHWGRGEEDGTDAFARFLAAVSDEVFAAVAAPDDLGVLAGLLPDNLSDVVLALCAFEMARYRGADRGLIKASEALMIHGVWPRRDADIVMDRLVEMYAALGDRLGLEPVPPLQWSDVAYALMSVFEGFFIFGDVFPDLTDRQHRWEPAVPASDPTTRWSLPAIAVEALVQRMTRPVSEERLGDQRLDQVAATGGPGAKEV